MKKIFALYLFLLIFVDHPSVAQEERCMNVLVYPFKNAVGQQYSWISAGLTDTVISDLRKTESMNIFSDEDRKKALAEIALSMTGIIDDKYVVKIGDIMGADLVFTGSYIVAGNTIKITARLFDIKTSKVQKSRQIEGPLDRIFEVEDSIVTAILEDAQGVTIAGVKKAVFTEKDKTALKKTHEIPTKAFELYSKAMELSEKNPKGALALIEKAVKIDPQYYQAHMLSGGLYIVEGNMQKAAESFDMVKKIMESQNLLNSMDYADLQLGISLYYHTIGDYTKTLEYCNASKKIRDSHGKKLRLDYASTLGCIAQAQRGLVNLQAALSSAIESKEILEDIGLKRSIFYAQSLSEIGTDYVLLNDNEKGLEYLLDAMKMLDKISLRKTSTGATSLSVMGNVYLLKADMPKAMNCQKESVAIFESLGLKKSLNYGSALLCLGSIHLVNGKYCEGVPYMKKAIDVFTALGHSKADQIKTIYEQVKNGCGK